ncbi:MAG: polymer-forming cytoskeletal protein [Paludibacteraceae bacterium]|nr:polymer-forming cytoskeletal protein [Paludibacteraceae bacterium]
MSKENENQNSTYNLIAAGTKMTGDITSSTNFRLDGSINGTLKCKGKVIIGQNGAMEGTLECDNAEILGKFTGKLIVNETLSLKATSKVEGEIKTKILSVEPNAKFTGTCDMNSANPQIQNPQIKK